MTSKLTLQTIHNVIPDLSQKELYILLQKLDYVYYGYHEKQVSNKIYDTLVSIYNEKFDKTYQPNRGIHFSPLQFESVTDATYGNIQLQDKIEGFPVTLWYQKQGSEHVVAMYFGFVVKQGDEAMKYIQVLSQIPSLESKENELWGYEACCIHGIIPTKSILKLGIDPKRFNGKKTQKRHVMEVLYETKKRVPFYTTCITIVPGSRNERVITNKDNMKHFGCTPLYTIVSANNILVNDLYDLRNDDVVMNDNKAYGDLEGFIIREYKPIEDYRFSLFYKITQLTEQITVENVTWCQKKRENGILKPKITFRLHRQYGTTPRIATLDGATVVQFHIGKGSILIIPTLSLKAYNNPNKVLYNFPVFDVIKKSSKKSVLPSPKVYGDYDWNNSKTNFVMSKTKKEKLYETIIQFHKLFCIPYRSKDILHYVELGTVTCIEDFYTWDPLTIYQTYPSLSMETLFVTYGRLKKVFQRAPLYKLMHMTTFFPCTSNKLFWLVDTYPELLIPNTDVNENRHNHISVYKTIKEKMPLFFDYVSRIHHFEFLEDKTFRISFSLDLKGQNVVLHNMVDKKKEKRIVQLHGTIQKTINEYTTMFIVRATEKASIKKIKEKHPNKHIVGITDAFFSLYFMSS